MLREIFDKIKEGILSILPIYLIIIIMNFLPFVNLHLSSNYILIFSISSILAAIGITLFNIGADIAMSPMGKSIGGGLTKQGKFSILIVVSFLLGLLLTISEPDLGVLAQQLSSVINSWLFIISVGIGVALFLVISILRIIFKIDLSKLLIVSYAIVFALSIFVVLKGNKSLLPFIMDSGGVTTGPITVPFMMALCIGTSSILAKKSDKDMSFGLMGLCSVGAIIVVLILGIFLNSSKITYEIPDYSLPTSIASSLFSNLFSSFKEVLLSLSLIVGFFIICNFLFLKISFKKLLKIFVGIIYTLLGLVIFLAAVNTGFIPVGYQIGQSLALDKITTLIFAFVVGAVTVLAEPAVHVLNKQIVEVTQGIVKKRTMLIGLMLGVAISLVLSIIRIYFQIDLMYFLIPGFMLCLILTFFIPKVYVAIAFDSGGVAAGAMTSSFLLPLTIGICTKVFANSTNFTALILENAFGVVAMVAMTPLIVVELIGLIAIITDKRRIKRQVSEMINQEDEIIIRFEVQNERKTN